MYGRQTLPAVAMRALHVDFLYHIWKQLVQKVASDQRGALPRKRQLDPTPPRKKPHSCVQRNARAYHSPKCRCEHDIPERGIQILQLPNTPCLRAQLSILHLDRDKERRAAEKKAGVLPTSNRPRYI